MVSCIEIEEHAIDRAGGVFFFFFLGAKKDSMVPEKPTHPLMIWNSCSFKGKKKESRSSKCGYDGFVRADE